MGDAPPPDLEGDSDELDDCVDEGMFAEAVVPVALSPVPVPVPQSRKSPVAFWYRYRYQDVIFAGFEQHLPRQRRQKCFVLFVC